MIGRIDIEHTDELLVAIEAIEAFVEKCPDHLWRARAAGSSLLEKLSDLSVVEPKSGPQARR